LASITKKQFRDWLVSSNGRAVRWVKEHGDKGLERVIEEAITRCLIFDTDYCYDQGWFLAEIIEASSHPQRHIDLALVHYSKTKKARNRWHLSKIIIELAQRGHPDCIAFINNHWRAELNKNRDDLAIGYLKLDRKGAYREILHHLAKTKIVALHTYENTWLIHSEASEIIGEKTASKILRQKMKRFPQLERTREPQRADIDKPEPTIPVDENVTIEQLRTWAKNIGRSKIVSWMRKASESQLREVAPILNEELSDLDAFNWLWCFRMSSFLGDVQWVIKWVHRERTHHTACCLLSKIRDPLARKTAVDLIQKERDIHNGLEILESNFEKGDEAWILSLLPRVKQIDRYHWSMSAAFGIATHNPKGKWREVMRYLYEHTPCEQCRGDFAPFMLRRGWLLDEELEDMCWDASEQNRLWARKTIRQRERRTQPT
jgi:hypothetical protein